MRHRLDTPNILRKRCKVFETTCRRKSLEHLRTSRFIGNMDEQLLKLNKNMGI